jgi:serine/threonine protein kinase
MGGEGEDENDEKDEKDEKEEVTTETHIGPPIEPLVKTEAKTEPRGAQALHSSGPPPKSGLSSVFPKKVSKPPQTGASQPPPKVSQTAAKISQAPPKIAPSASRAPPPVPASEVKQEIKQNVRQDVRQPSLIPPPKAPPRTGFEFRRGRAYAFALDDEGAPILLGSGRFARLYLGYERWEESLTHQMRPVVIKMLQQELDDDDITRFRQEKSLLEYMQGHPSIIELLASGTIEEAHLPPVVRTHCGGDFLILEKLDMTLMERLKGTRSQEEKEDLLALGMRDRLIRALDYVIPVASAIEFAHIVRDVSHRDIHPSNILLKLPDPKLAGSAMQVRLSDFSAAKLAQHDGVTRIGAGVPGTMYFQSPEQETNLLGILVDVKKGSREVEYFEDFYVHIAKNDTFALVNREQQYVIREVDRSKKRIVLETPFAEASEQQVRANVQKRVGRPADVYAIGALLYYLASGASRNPKTLNDSFRKFDEYDRPGSDNEIEHYLRGEYEALDDARGKVASKGESALFRHRHFLDGNDEPIPFDVMRIITRCMIRDKVDSYCASNDLQTTAITKVVRDILALQAGFGVSRGIVAESPRARANGWSLTLARSTSAVSKAYKALLRLLRRASRS